MSVSILGRLFSSSKSDSRGPRADLGSGAVWYSLDDPGLADFFRAGGESATGATISIDAALRNPAMFRACSLISNSLGMLPFHLLDKQTRKKATDHPLFKILHRRPNGWQTAFDFRAGMQLRALVKGNAYALIVRGRDLKTGRDKIVRLIPIDPEAVTPVMSADWTLTYRYQPKQGASRMLATGEVFHLRGLSVDGVNGLSLVKQARDAIAISIAAELAVGRMFKHGAMVGGALMHKGKLGDSAFERLKASLAEKEGAGNAGKNLILEEGMEWKAYGQSAKESQMTELRKLQVEEIARVTGVPRPLLMVDETSWGSGIEALGQFFVAYALGPWFEAWQQATERSLLDDDEADRYEVKFNPAALLRGSLKDQADFLSKALGAGGHAPWMHVDEVRDVMDLPEREAPPHTMMGVTANPASGDDSPAKAKKTAATQDEIDDEEN